MTKIYINVSITIDHNEEYVIIPSYFIGYKLYNHEIYLYTITAKSRVVCYQVKPEESNHIILVIQDCLQQPVSYLYQQLTSILHDTTTICTIHSSRSVIMNYLFLNPSFIYQQQIQPDQLLLLLKYRFFYDSVYPSLSRAHH